MEIFTHLEIITGENGTVSKNVTSGNNVVVGYSSYINGDVYYYGTWSSPPASGHFTGTLLGDNKTNFTNHSFLLY